MIMETSLNLVISPEKKKHTLLKHFSILILSKFLLARKHIFSLDLS